MGARCYGCGEKFGRCYECGNSHHRCAEFSPCTDSLDYDEEYADDATE